MYGKPESQELIRWLRIETVSDVQFAAKHA